MLTERLHLPQRYREQLEALLREHVPDAEVWAYGSRTSGQNHDGSDLDIVLRGPGLEPLGGGYYDLIEALQESNIPILVQAHDWAHLPESFHREIERDYVVVQSRGIVETGSRDAWHEVTLAECAEFNDSTYSPKEAWPVINYLDTGNISENRVSEIQMLEPGKDKIPSRSRRKVQPGDIVYSTVRPNQRHFGLLKSVPKHFLASTGFAVLRGKAGVADTGYIYWFLAQDSIVEYLHSIAENSTSAYPSIRSGDLEQLTLSLPPLPEQRAIAHVLGTLDDKIELNRRMNETLEEMAQALFKDWFVDFGPVRAKIEGHEPYLPPDLWSLFPERLVDSELGPIPEGWEVRRLGDCYDLTMGQSPPGNTYNDEGMGMPFFQGRTDFGFRYPENRKSCTAPTRIAQLDDTLVSVRAPVGDINMAWEKSCVGRGIAALRHRSGSRSFTYYATQAVQPILREYEHTGTVFGAINKSQFESLLVIEPSSGVIDAFESVAWLLDERIRSGTANSRALATERDALLPKLVSGVVRVGVE